MKQKAKSAAKTAVKVIGVTFFAAGAMAVVTSETALKSIGTGLKVAGEAIENIASDIHKEMKAAKKPTEKAPIAEEAQEEPSAEETNFAEA